MRSGLFQALLDRIAQRVTEMARGLKGRVLDFVTRRRRRASRDDLQPVMQTFDDPYLEELGDAFGHVTGQRLTVEQMRRFIVGEVTLSRRLYQQSVQTSSAVARLLNEHTRYAHDARKLAVELYEGYGFRRREILNPRVRLPRYLDDALLNREMDALLARIQAATLKTPALRAAYLDMLDAIIRDKGEQAIDRALETAVQERYRYFANRIAQTELARAQNQETARELMADPEIEVVRYQLSATHPAPDICDALAYADRYGLGPGLYPKALAPLPPSHPFCRCGCVPVRGLSAANAREDPEAIQKYLFFQDPKTAARIAGSRAKRDAVLKGGNLLDLINAKRQAWYRIGTLGEAILKDVKPSAYDIAKSGGRHEGFLKDHAKKTDNELHRSIRSLQRQIETHQDKIANPQNWVTPGLPPQQMNGLVNSYWPKEIANFTQQIEILQGILSERNR